MGQTQMQLPAQPEIKGEDDKVDPNKQPADAAQAAGQLPPELLMQKL